MRLLILGGTAFLGHEVARQAVAAGHDVTCVARGESGGVPDGAALVRADRDRDDGLEAVAGDYDTVLDVARQPGQVRRAVAVLAGRVGHAVFVSTGNVYAEHGLPAGDESSALLEPLAGDVMPDMGSYGPAKVACEQAVMAGFGADRSTIVRSMLIGGPGDVSGRSAYWPWRFAHPAADDGSVLVPDAPALSAALLDVRDLAAWLLLLAERRVAGVFDAGGPPRPLPDLLSVAREVAGHTGPVVAIDPGWLADQGVSPWMGPDSLPLWLDDEDWVGFAARTSDRARAAGLTFRPLAETLADVLAATTATPAGAGLSDDRERELLKAWRRRNG